VRTKNISIQIRKGKKVPQKETYVVFYKRKSKIKIDQKFINPSLNQSITLEFQECERLMNLFNSFLFDGKFKPIKDKMVIFEID